MKLLGLILLMLEAQAVPTGSSLSALVDDSGEWTVGSPGVLAKEADFSENVVRMGSAPIETFPLRRMTTLRKGLNLAPEVHTRTDELRCLKVRTSASPEAPVRGVFATIRGFLNL